MQKQYLENVQQNNDDSTTENNSDVRYFKLPYLGVSSVLLKKKLSSLIKKCCKTASIRLVFASLKIGILYFSPKDKLLEHLKSNVIYKFTCAGCNASYIGKMPDTLKHVLMDAPGRINCLRFINIDMKLRAALIVITMNAFSL